MAALPCGQPLQATDVIEAVVTPGTYVQATVSDIGTPGPRGYSAYQLAQQEGYSGSLEEWLAQWVVKTGDTMTGPLQVPAGIVSAPGLQVGGADTGLYQDADGISAAVNGTAVARLAVLASAPAGPAFGVGVTSA